MQARSGSTIARLLTVHLEGVILLRPPLRDSDGGALVPHNKHTRVRAGGTRQKGSGELTQALHLLRTDETRGASCPPNRHITSGRYTAYCVVHTPTPSGAPVAHSPPKVDLIRRQSIWRSRHNPPSMRGPGPNPAPLTRRACVPSVSPLATCMAPCVLKMDSNAQASGRILDSGLRFQILKPC